MSGMGELLGRWVDTLNMAADDSFENLKVLDQCLRNSE
jgi:hypothetical protein